MRYKLEKSEKENHWVCTDVDNLIVCTFENQNFNDNQKFTLLENCKADANVIAKLMSEMGDWLFKHHYEKIFKCKNSK